MAHKILIAALGMIAAASPLSANSGPAPATAAPEAGPGARYCMYVEPVTGSRVETIKCWTRQQWADQGVDVDKDWSKEGVAVLS